MDKYIDKSEYETIQLMIGIDQEDYVEELFHAVFANNVVAVNYMITRLPSNDVYNLVTDLLSNTDDVLIAEVLLEAINFRVFRRLNTCLSRIENLEVLEYLLTHDYAQFNIAYRKSECLRYATLKNDYERVKLFVAGRKYKNYSLTCRGMDTANKCAVELAYFNKNDKILKLFINSGVNYIDVMYSLPLLEHLRNLKAEICKSKCSNKRKIIEMYEKHEEIPDKIIEQAFPECLYDKRIGKIKTRRLIRSAYHSASF
jgi:hypothetical protein